PEHLEEGVVARGPADVLEVVVLAARADAFLAGGRAHVVAPFLTEEHGLELHHARVGEEEGRVGSGDERRRPHARVTVALEIGHELLADRAAGHRKSTRLNSSHVASSYAVFCLKKKKNGRSYDRDRKSTRLNSSHVATSYAV